MNIKSIKKYWADFDWRDFRDVTGYTFCYDLFWNIRDGFTNIVTWWPIIWRDRWFDHHYFFEVMYKKLSLMEYEFRVNSHILHGPRYARRMKICMKLIKRIQSEDYGDCPVDLSVRLREEVIDANLTRVRFSTTPAEDFAIKQWGDRHFKCLNKDLDVLFRILRKNIQYFWD